MYDKTNCEGIPKNPEMQTYREMPSASIRPEWNQLGAEEKKSK